MSLARSCTPVWPLVASKARIVTFFLIASALSSGFAALPACAQATTAQTAGKPVTPGLSRPRRMFGATPVLQGHNKRDVHRIIPDDPLAAFKKDLALAPVNMPSASFIGNTTVITASANNGMMMARETDCSLTAFNVPYSYDPTEPYSAPLSKTTDYNLQLHTAAGLTTKGNNFGGHCADPKVGINSWDLLYAGMSTGGMRMSAVAAYSPSADNNVLYTFVMQENGALVSETTQPLPSSNQPVGVVAGDLNGDGNPDIIAVGFVPSPSPSAVITVLLGNADGTFTVGQTYTLGVGTPNSAIIDDFNGDGKLDVVVPIQSASSAAGVVTFLPGKGDGTFGVAKTLAIPAYTNNLASGDFNGDGKKDMVGGTGAVFLGNGDGSFQLQSTPAFSSLDADSSETGFLATGDFNKDGKLDLAAGTGISINIFLGNGNGTFTPGMVYAGIDNHGYLAATDLDGDGNLDLFSGSAQGGIFTGDDFVSNEGYALMGRGDGTFIGAPMVDYATFNQMEDLNGDGKPDFIGLGGTPAVGNTLPTFTFGTFYGRGDGTFAQAGATLNASTFNYGGTPYTTLGIDSYGTADLNGDGHTDLVYLPSAYYALNPTNFGYVTALGKPGGGFQTPVFTQSPSLVPDGGADYVTALAGLQLVTNENGKPEVLYGFQSEEYVSSNNSVMYYQGFATQVSNGDGTFGAPALTVTYSGTSPATNYPGTTPVLTADLNGDRIPDMILYTSPSIGFGGAPVAPSNLQVMLGNSDGTFKPAVTLPTVANPSGEDIAVADINGDGIPDLVAQGVPNNSTTQYYELLVSLGKGDGTFTAGTAIPLNGNLGPLTIGDFTGDGKPDIAVVNNGILPGNGDGTFQTLPSGNNDGTVIAPLSLPLYGGGSQFGALAGAYDINNDGKLDLVGGTTFFIQPAVSTSLDSSATALAASAATVSVGATLTLSATVTAATGSGTPSGNVTFLDGTTSLGTAALDSSGKATLSTTTLAAGTHSLTATYSGDSTFASSTSKAVSVTVVTGPVLPASTTTLSASASTAITGQSITFTATVAGPSGNATVPTGKVTFLNGTTSLGTGTLSSGVATLATTALPLGADLITANYAGDTNFAGSVSSAVTVTVTAPAADFSISLSPTSASVNGGSSATSTVSIAALHGFTGTVSFTCSGLATSETCSFAPTTVKATGSAAATTKLTIATSATIAHLRPAENGWPGGRSAIAFGIVLLGIGGLSRGRRRWMQSALAASTLAVLLGLASCGGSGPKGSTTSVTVTAKSGSLSHSATFSLTVQ